MSSPPSSPGRARRRLRGAPGSPSTGRTLVEALTALALMAILTLVAVPGLAEAHRTAALRGLAQLVGGQLARARAHAVVNHCTSALVFERRGPWVCYLATDGDGDGVRRDDLAAGTDPVEGPVVRLVDGPSGLGILASEPVPDPAGGGPLGGALDDPVRGGAGDIVSFSPFGTASPASVYLTDHHGQMRVLRVYGATGRTRCMVWRSGWEAWRQGWW